RGCCGSGGHRFWDCSRRSRTRDAGPDSRAEAPRLGRARGGPRTTQLLPAVLPHASGDVSQAGGPPSATPREECWHGRVTYKQRCDTGQHSSCRG
ncbi:unnamed protein product, partial [Scytosiphon promiscuus]